MNKKLTQQDILLAIIKNERLIKEFLISLNIDIKKEDKIIYTKYNNLININNSIYINIIIGDKKKISIYNAFKYYFEYFKNNNYTFYYININNFNNTKIKYKELLLQIKDRNTNDVLIDNFNIIIKSLGKRKELWSKLLTCETLKELDKISNIIITNK